MGLGERASGEKERERETGKRRIEGRIACSRQDYLFASRRADVSPAATTAILFRPYLFYRIARTHDASHMKKNIRQQTTYRSWGAIPEAEFFLLLGTAKGGNGDHHVASGRETQSHDAKRAPEGKSHRI